MNFNQYKKDLLKETMQVVVFNSNGEYLDSCHSLEDLYGFKETVFERSHFLKGVKSELIELKANGILNYYCVSDSFFNARMICDYRIEKVKNGDEEVFNWVIIDQTQLYKEVIEKGLIEGEIQNEYESIKQHVNELEQELKVNQMISSKIYNEIKVPISGLKYLCKSVTDQLEFDLKKRYQQSSGIITGFLEYAIGQMVLTELKETNTPFKIDQIISAVQDTFLGEADAHLIFEKEFESSIIIGNKHKMYTGLVRLLSNIIDSKPDGSIKIIFTYDATTRVIRVVVKSNLLPDALERITNKFLEISGSYEVLIEKGTLVMVCPIEEIKLSESLIQKKKFDDKAKLISRAEFPYLYQITNQDEEMVRDIVEGVLDVVPFELEKMMLQYQARDFDSLARTSHKVKPNFENLEQKQFINRIFEIEEAALAKNDEYLESNLSDFIREAGEKIEELKRIYT
ncbi:MAG: hypothetical protein R8N23_18690 [Reichenbachiella sp.]|uniref:hypothetical protein n=1 Tax=Reichenbachiella sp. TaxID=2184521 RepID=UPI0029666E48|nr:hypothetical protein [Reichenbachiella sp.]MDW3211905.1 hypothetical protein [Reichenbachiella sp.]